MKQKDPTKRIPEYAGGYKYLAAASLVPAAKNGIYKEMLDTQMLAVEWKL